MQEPARRQCLQWLGIKPLQSRQALRGALPSFDYFLAPDEEAMVSPQRAQPLQPEVPPENARKALSSLLQEKSYSQEKSHSTEKTGSETVSLPPVEPLSDNRSTAKAKGQRFRLRYVCFDAVLFLFEQPSLEWRDEQNQQIFLRDVARAIHAKQPDTLMTDTFVWPPNPQMADQDPLQMLVPFIHGLMRGASKPVVMAFGLSALESLASLSDLLDVPYLQAEPLPRYFEAPSTKRMLWQAMKQQLAL